MLSCQPEYDTDKIPKRGALGYTDTTGKFVVFNPTDLLFSVATFVATHFFDGEWKAIYPDTVFQTVNKNN